MTKGQSRLPKRSHPFFSQVGLSAAPPPPKPAPPIPLVPLPFPPSTPPPPAAVATPARPPDPLSAQAVADAVFRQVRVAAKATARCAGPVGPGWPTGIRI